MLRRRLPSRLRGSASQLLKRRDPARSGCFPGRQGFGTGPAGRPAAASCRLRCSRWGRGSKRPRPPRPRRLCGRRGAAQQLRLPTLCEASASARRWRKERGKEGGREGGKEGRFSRAKPQPGDASAGRPRRPRRRGAAGSGLCGSCLLEGVPAGCDASSDDGRRLQRPPRLLRTQRFGAGVTTRPTRPRPGALRNRPPRRGAAAEAPSLSRLGLGVPRPPPDR